jgi:anhydro-N-acetylmuramic acid kinase
MLEEPFLSLPPPKSTGRDLFNEEWLRARLSYTSEFTLLTPADIQATLAIFTATTIANAIYHYAPLTDKVFICGGGAKNAFLVSQLQAALKQVMPDTETTTSEAIGVNSTHIEALAFAWLAHRFTNRLPGNLPEVTGARGLRILGALYPGIAGVHMESLSAKTGEKA